MATIHYNFDVFLFILYITDSHSAWLHQLTASLETYTYSRLFYQDVNKITESLSSKNKTSALWESSIEKIKLFAQYFLVSKDFTSCFLAVAWKFSYF